METIVADITCNPKEDEKIYEKAGEILRAGGSPYSRYGCRI